MNKIIITGSEGLIGKKVANFFSKKREISKKNAKKSAKKKTVKKKTVSGTQKTVKKNIIIANKKLLNKIKFKKFTNTKSRF